MDLPTAWATGQVSVDGIDLQWYRTGEGSPVVFLHGMYDTGRRWVELGDDLADQYEVFAFDARAHGRSAAPETGYDMETRVDDLFGVLDACGIEQPVLVGHSMGAATAAFAAAREPDRIRGTVLADPSRFRNEPEIPLSKARSVTRQRLQQAAQRPFAELIEDHEEQTTLAQARRLARGGLECRPEAGEYAQEHPPVVNALADTSVPTLVLRRDVEPEERAADLDAVGGIENCRLVHIPDAGHHVFLDSPAPARAELQAFLQRH